VPPRGGYILCGTAPMNNLLSRADFGLQRTIRTIQEGSVLPPPALGLPLGPLLPHVRTVVGHKRLTHRLLGLFFGFFAGVRMLSGLVLLFHGFAPFDPVNPSWLRAPMERWSPGKFLSASLWSVQCTRCILLCETYCAQLFAAFIKIKYPFL